MKHLFLFFLILAIPHATIAQTSQKKVAVYITGDINQGYKKIIGSKIVSSVTQSEEYIAVERTTDFLTTLSREQDYQVSGMVSDDQIARLGAQFGVQYVIAADASEIFGSIFISARMINVESARIVASIDRERRVNSMDSLVSLAMDVSESLMSELLYSDLLNNVKIVGPIRTTKEFPEYVVSFSEKQIRHIAKMLTNRGQAHYPVLVDFNRQYSTANNNIGVTDYTVKVLNSNNSISEIGSYVSVLEDSDGMLKIRHNLFPTPFYIFERLR